MANARMGIMCRIATVIAVVLGIALTGFAETVTNVRASQRPNSNLVDIYYDLNATDGGTYTVEVTIEGRTDEVTATTFSGNVGEGVLPGKNRHIVWEAGADWRGKKGDVKAVVTATIEARIGKKPKRVQLWEGGPYWADRNIGADAPWKAGLYFWWGDTVGHRPSADGTFNFNFDYYNPAIYPIGKSMSELQSAGWVTSSGVLTSSHDAAHIKLGGSWRMPTEQEFENLISNSDWTWTTKNGVRGLIIRGRGNYTSNSIFFPAAGGGSGTSLALSGSVGWYWSSVLCPNDAKGFGFDSSGRFLFAGGGLHAGFPIRPVQEFTK